MCFGGVEVSSEDKESIEDGVARTDEEYAKRMVENAKREKHEKTWGFFGKYLVLGIVASFPLCWLWAVDTWWSNTLSIPFFFAWAVGYIKGTVGLSGRMDDFLNPRWPWVGVTAEIALGAVKVVLMLIWFMLALSGSIFFLYSATPSPPFQ